MSKRGQISRYLLILKKLKTYTSIAELQRYIDGQATHLQLLDDTMDIASSERTLKRDFKDIRTVFGIDIVYSRGRKGYYIAQSETENMNFQRMLEAFDVFNSLALAHDMAPFIHLEKRGPQGTESLPGILRAIKNRAEIAFSYQTFWHDGVAEKTAAPYALKEFKNRWYVLAMDNKDGQVKSFALDRLTEPEITNRKFTLPPGYDPEKTYANSFGIMSPNAPAPTEIILSFDAHQGKYIRTLPLHPTQQILLDTADELQVSLVIYVTTDFTMELLSHGEHLKVLQPQWLANEIREAHQKACERY